MKIKYFFILYIFITSYSFSQVGIGTTNPDTSSSLDISSANSGLLIPRISLIDVSNGIAPINTPAISLLIYNINPAVIGGNGEGYYYWNGTEWKKLTTTDGNDWNISGNSGTDPSINFIGTTDFNDLVFKANNNESLRIKSNIDKIGLYNSNPDYNLDINTENFAITYPRNGLRIKKITQSGIKKGSFFGFDTTNENETLIWNYGSDENNFYNKSIVFGLGNDINPGNSVAKITSHSFGIFENNPNYALDVKTDPADAVLHPSGKNGLRVNSSLNSSSDYKGFFFGVNDGSVIDSNNAYIWNYGDGSFLDNKFISFGLSADIANGEIMRLYRDRVGIGTNVNTGSLVSLMDNSGAYKNGINIRNVVTNDDFYIGLKTNTSPSDSEIMNKANANLEFGTNNTTRMLINGFGNVGIGTTLPNAPLQFSNSVVNRKIVLYDTNNNDNQYYGFGINGGMLRYQTDALGADHVFFAGANSTTSNELMRIKGTGNVGIGISNPLQRLDVQGGNARINNTYIGDIGWGTNWAGISHYNQANTTGYGFLQSNDGNYTFLNKQNTGLGYIGFRVGNLDQAVITNAGNMGIGTTNPTEKLEVNGKIKITDGTQGNGKVLVSDVNGTGTWTTTNSIKPAVTGVFAGGGGNPNSTTSVYCNTYIDLPPGKWMIFGTYLLAGSTTLPSGQSVFVRTTFQLSDIVTGANPYVVSGGLISGILAGPTDFGIANGQTIINNNTAGTIRFYMWANIQKYGPIPVTFSMSGIGSSFWSENQLSAIPMN
jgi:hypothetical protein